MQSESPDRNSNYRHPNPVIDVLRRVEPFATIRRKWRALPKREKAIRYDRQAAADARQAMLSRSDDIGAMARALQKSDPIYLPSRQWEYCNTKNVSELDTRGFDLFKQTAAQNYFTWVIPPTDSQFQYLREHTDSNLWLEIEEQSRHINEPSDIITPEQQQHLYQFNAMLWRFAQNHDAYGILHRLEEPALGSPFPMTLDGKRISQDLANSVIEYNSIREGWQPKGTPTICELGAGYGRTAYIFLSEIPCRYIVIDIPPAMHIAQRYLSTLFPDKKVFRFRDWDNFSNVADELGDADLAFLLPHQAAQLPDNYADLSLTISSLHEMTKLQSDVYLKMLDRLTHGAFYLKQWSNWYNPYDDLAITKDHYPIPPHWKEIYSRPAKVQPLFFEAMYRVT